MCRSRKSFNTRVILLNLQMLHVLTIAFSAILASFSTGTTGHHSPAEIKTLTLASYTVKPDSTDSLYRADLIAFAQTLKGTPYKYACSDPEKGFDCSGFVQYVFNHFQIAVPRSSIDFTRIGKTVDLKSAMPGDLILFTGTNSKVRRVGHVGIITHASDSVVFIHASSGKKTHAVTETALNPHYKKRFIKVVRMLK